MKALHRKLWRELWQLRGQSLAYAGARDEDGGLIELTAPVDVVVLRRHFFSGRTLQPGDEILEIGDVASLEVDVLSADAVRIEPGMKVYFTRWGREEPQAGRVRRIEPGRLNQGFRPGGGGTKGAGDRLFHRRFGQAAKCRVPRVRKLG